MTRLIALSIVGRSRISGNEVGNHGITAAGSLMDTGTWGTGNGNWERRNVWWAGSGLRSTAAAC
jgi:hypothetical protein